MWNKFSDRRALVELRRIADSLEVIALYAARLDGRMWNPKSSSRRVRLVARLDKEDAELLHTVDEEIRVRQLQDEMDFMSQGVPKE